MKLSKKYSEIDTVLHSDKKLLAKNGGKNAKKKPQKKSMRGLTWKVSLLNLKKKNDVKMKKLFKNKLKSSS